MSKHKTSKIGADNLRRQHEKIQSNYANDNLSLKRIFIVVLVILIILALFYLLTVGILNKKTKVKLDNNTTIQYKEILAGTTFSQKQEEYLVFFYDSEADDAKDNYDLVSQYSEKNSKLFMYVVDLAEGLNRNCISDTDNFVAKDSSELKISRTTVLKIKNGEIVDYVVDNIENYLNK